MKEKKVKNIIAGRKQRKTVPIAFGIFLYILSLLLPSLPITGIQASPAQATIAKYLNFQGKLTKTSDGTNVSNGSYAVEFKLYDALTSGTLLWTETYDQPSGACTKLVVTSGVFNAKLGSCNSLASIDFTGGALYLSVNFAPTGTSYDGEMAPRKQLVASPYAFVANSVVGDGKIDVANTTGPQATIGYDSSNKLQVSVGSTGATTLTANGSGAAFLFSGGNVGVGGAATAKLQTTSTTEQLRVAYDASNYAAFTTSSGGNLTVAPSGGTLNITGTETISSILQVGGATATTYSRFGTATTGHSLSGANALLVSGALEVDGNAFADGQLTIGSFASATSVPVCSNSGTLSTCNSNPSGVTLQQAYDATSGNTITTTSARNIAFTFAANTSLTLDAAATDTTQTSGVIDLDVDSLTNGASAIDLNFEGTGSTSSATQNGLALTIVPSNTTNARTYNGIKITNPDAGSVANTITGLNVDVTTANSSDTTYAATFQGGKVGVGTASPDQLLTVVGVGHFNTLGAATSGGFNFTNGAGSGYTTYDGFFYNTGASGWYLTNSAPWLTASTGSTNKIKGLSGQTVDIFEVQNSSAAALLSVGNTGLTTIAPAVSTSGSPTLFTVTGPAHTTLTASTEASDVNINLARTVQFATGALTTQRAALIQAPSYGFAGASTLTTAATLDITGAPKSQTNATITNSYALNIEAGAVQPAGTVTNAYGLSVNGPTGATNNYAAIFQGGNVGIGTTNPAKHLEVIDSGNHPVRFGSDSSNYIDLLIGGASAVWSASGTQTIGFNGSNGGYIDILGSNNTVLKPNSNKTLDFSANGSGVGFRVISDDLATEYLNFTAGGVLARWTISGSKPMYINVNGNEIFGLQGTGLSIGTGYSSTASPSNGMIIQGNVGIGDSSPAALLTVGSGDLFQVNSSGAIAAATGVTSSGTITFSGFSTNGGLLYTNGSGVLAQTGAGTATTILHGGTTPSYSAISLTADITGVLPVANGGTNCSSASITCFNNITGYTASGATGTTSTNLVFSTSPTLTTPSITTSATLTNNAIGATSTDGFLLTNTTAAAAGAQQWSPRLHFTGQGWKTTATAASQATDWIVENQPIQGAANPTTNLVFSSQVNGGGYTARETLSSAGDLTISGQFIAHNQNPAGQTTGIVTDGIYMTSGNFYTGSTEIIVNANGVAGRSSNYYALTPGSNANSPDTYWTRGGVATWQAGNANAASPVAQTLQAQGSRSGTDSNIAGANLTIQSGNGTGNSTGSSLIFNTPVAVASGTGAQTQTATLTLQGGNAVFGGTLSVTGHTTFEGVTSTGATGTGKLVYDGTPTLVTPVLGAATYTTLSGGNITDSGLTAGRVTFAGTAGLLVDDADLTFATDTLTVTKIAATSLTGNVTLSDVNMVLGTSTGTKFGTATSQKLAFYNSTPIVQPSGDVATALSSLGLVASPTIVATTNANLTGPITSVGNATSIASQTGTGTKFVVDTSPTLITPVLGVATGTSLALTYAGTAAVTTASALVLNANSLTTGTGEYIASSTLSSGILLDLAITGTAGLTNQKGINVSLSGANGTGAQTTYGGYFSNTHTGTSTNVGLYATASGGSNNYAAIFDQGFVGINNTAPGVKLDIIQGNGIGARILSNSSSQWTALAVGRTATEAQFGVSGGSNVLINGDAAGDTDIISSGHNILFSTDTGSTAQMYLKNGGNVGINQTSPDAKLDIVNAAIANAKSLVKLTGTTTTSTSSGTAYGLYNSFTNANTTNTDTAYSIYNTVVDATALANTIYGGYDTIALSGNAAKTGVGQYLTVSTSSTMADTIIGNDVATSATGIIGSGTRSNYGARLQPASTSANTGGTQNLYGIYSAPSSTLAAGSTENVYGGYFKATGTVASGTINSYGLYVANPSMNTTGTSTKYGLYVEDVTANAADNNYAAIFAGGNVGIGTTTPGTKLQVSGAPVNFSGNNNTGVYGTSDLFDPTTAALGVGGVLTFQGYFNGTSSAAAFAAIRGIKENGTSNDAAGALALYTAASGNPLTEKMRITSGGNVGIGVTPSFKLDVNGTTNLSSTLTQSGGYAYLGNSNQAGAYPRAGNDLAIAWNFLGAPRDVDFWNTDTAPATTSFDFRQLTGASTSIDLLSISGTGSLTLPNDASALIFGDLGANSNTTQGVIKFASASTSSNTTCATATNQGLVFQDEAGTRKGHICFDTTAGMDSFGASWNTLGTDLAENYSDVAGILEPGDVVMIDPTGPRKAIIKANKSYSALVIGAIATEPGFLMTEISLADGSTELVNPKPVALAGRIPVKVTNENGNIAPGDYLTSSATRPGYAMKATYSGQVIGQALENFNNSELNANGKILVFVKSGWQNIGNTIVLDAPSGLEGQNQSTVQGTMQTGSLTSANSASTFIIKQKTAADNSVADILQLQSGNINRLMVASNGAATINAKLASGFVLDIKNNDSSLFQISSSGNAYIYGVLVVKKDLAVLGTILGTTSIAAKNDGPDTIQQGDVVMLKGATDPILGDNPTLTITKATATGSTNSIVVVGIADRNLSDFNLGPNATAGGDPKQIPTGQYLNVVTNGSFKTINVDAGFAAISVGDKLTISSHAGFAKKLGDGESGPLIGIALDNLSGGAGSVRVYLMLNTITNGAANISGSANNTPQNSTNNTTPNPDTGTTDNTGSANPPPNTSSDPQTNNPITVTEPQTQSDLPVTDN